MWNSSQEEPTSHTGFNFQVTRATPLCGIQAFNPLASFDGFFLYSTVRQFLCGFFLWRFLPLLDGSSAVPCFTWRFLCGSFLHCSCSCSFNVSTADVSQQNFQFDDTFTVPTCWSFVVDVGIYTIHGSYECPLLLKVPMWPSTAWAPPMGGWPTATVSRTVGFVCLSAITPL